MPNHITNVVKILSNSSERAQEVMAAAIDLNGGIFDFNRIVPMPDILRGTNSPNNVNGSKCLEETGYDSWYTFSVNEWGTKWNAYSQRNSIMLNDIGNDAEENERLVLENIKANGGYPTIVRFETAWSTPVQLYSAFSEKFPDVTIEVLYADEDTGYNCGTLMFNAGLPTYDNSAPAGNSRTPSDDEYWEKFAESVYCYDVGC